MKHKKHARVVTIGGGTGTFVLLNALKAMPLELAAVVSMADDGGSTGILRDQYGVLPPGDIRRALVALSQSEKSLRDLFTYRFRQGDLDGHSFGNIFLTALEKITGSFGRAVDEAGRLLNIRGQVIPATLKNVRLHARLADNTLIKGEGRIDVSNGPRAPIRKVWLSPRAVINPKAREAFRRADVIIIGPGDLYTSIIPTLLVEGVPAAIRSSKAKVIYIANVMTKRGETDGFKAENFLQEMEEYLGKGVIDIALFNKKKPPTRLLKKYSREGARFVEPPQTNGERKYVIADVMDTDGLIRHSSKKLKAVLAKLLKER